MLYFFWITLACICIIHVHVGRDKEKSRYFMWVAGWFPSLKDRNNVQEKCIGTKETKKHNNIFQDARKSFVRPAYDFMRI